MLIKLFLLLFSFVLVACDRAGTSASASSPLKESIVPVELGNRKFSMTESAAENIVVRDQVGWAALWRERMAGINPVAPPVNFEQEMVAGIFLGAYANSCYAIALVSVEQEGEQTRVVYRVNPPADTDICAQAIIYPLKLIAVPKKSGDVLFIDASKKQ